MTQKIIGTEIVKNRYAVLTVEGRSGNYRVDVTNGRCSCPAWKFSKVGDDGKRRPCKHLIAMGWQPSSLPAAPKQSKQPSAQGPATDYTDSL